MKTTKIDGRKLGKFGIKKNTQTSWGKITGMYTATAEENTLDHSKGQKFWMVKFEDGSGQWLMKVWKDIGTDTLEDISNDIFETVTDGPIGFTSLNKFGGIERLQKVFTANEIEFFFFGTQDGVKSSKIS